MRRRHFDALRPVCPSCRVQGRVDRPLVLAKVIAESENHIVEGILQCPEGSCSREYPILDGIPILLHDLRGFVQGHTLELLRRDDLSASMESLLGDCCGPGTAYDAWRQHRSTYGCSHYGDLWRAVDDQEADDPSRQVDAAVCRSLLELLESSLDLAMQRDGDETPSGPWLDLGCAVGRTSLELARKTDDLVLGVDLHFGMVSLATRLLRGETVQAPRRRSGVVYERRGVQLAGSALNEAAERVDFWLCDALALPFPGGSFAGTLALNVLDCLASPFEGLQEMARTLQVGGTLSMCSPYDWSTGATPFEGWLGGHSDRGADGGDAARRLRQVLAQPSLGLGLENVGERRYQPWKLRLHDRSVMQYQVDVLALRRSGSELR